MPETRRESSGEEGVPVSALLRRLHLDPYVIALLATVGIAALVGIALWLGARA